MAGRSERPGDHRKEAGPEISRELPIQPKPPTEDEGPDWLVPEDLKARQMVYLVTFSALVEPEASVAAASTALKDVSNMTRDQIRDAVLDAVANPAQDVKRGGKPRSVKLCVVKMGVFREPHANGKFHFHVPLKLNVVNTWLGVRNALRQRHGLASHWSSSHTEFSSAVRYCYKTTEKKTVVDTEYISCTADGTELDMAKESDAPWNANVRRQRREKAERLAHAPAENQKGEDVKRKSQKKATPFTKLDFYAMVETEGWKTPAQVLGYARNHGSEKFKLFVARPKRQLQELLHQAKDWAHAEEEAEKERLSDWDLVKTLAQGECDCGGGLCQWWEAALDFFERNSSTLDRKALAGALAAVIRFGPGKTSRVPLIVGSTNSAKSTVLNAIIDVFGFTNVVHRPGEKGSMALANLMKETKRSIYWDEVRPVELAARGAVPVAQFLSLFSGGAMEVTVSQSFNDGNGECRWRRGAAMTAKAEGLWDQLPLVPGLMPVTGEDIKHMKTRVREFHAAASVTGEFADVPQCGASFCRWLLVDAASFANGSPEKPLRKLAGKALPSLVDVGSQPVSPSSSAVGSKRPLTEEEQFAIAEKRAEAIRRKRARDALEDDADPFDFADLGFDAA